VAIVATAALGEIFASPSRLRSAFYAVERDTGDPSLVTLSSRTVDSSPWNDERMTVGVMERA